MTNKTDKSPDKVTDAGAVELEENELDNVTGGAGYLKLGDIKGESIDKASGGHNKSIDILSTDWGSGGTKQGPPPTLKKR